MSNIRCLLSGHKPLSVGRLFDVSFVDLGVELSIYACSRCGVLFTDQNFLARNWEWRRRDTTQRSATEIEPREASTRPQVEPTDGVRGVW